MKLSEYLKPLDVEARERLATECGTTLGHLRNVAFSGKPCGTKLAVAIEIKSGHAVRRWELCPVDWWAQWPELIGVEGAPPVPGTEGQAEPVAKAA